METVKRMCICCMQEHEVKVIQEKDRLTFKGVTVEYNAEYCYCDIADEYYAEEEQVSANDIAMKDAYRVKMNLLTSRQIMAIRTKYGISQSDLCLLLGWGAKTITRYESHHVQDIAHDTILRKLDADPEWFLELLHAAKDTLPPAAYKKYLATGITLFEQNHDRYLKSAIMAKNARLLYNPKANTSSIETSGTAYTATNAEKEAEEKGIKKGIKKTTDSIIQRMLINNIALSTILISTEATESYIRNIAKKIGVNVIL